MEFAWKVKYDPYSGPAAIWYAVDRDAGIR